MPLSLTAKYGLLLSQAVTRLFGWLRVLFLTVCSGSHDILFEPQPIFEAVKRNDVDLVVALLDAGASASCVDSKGLTPLRLAVDSGSVEIARTLIMYGADPNWCCSDGWGGMHASIVEGSPKIVEEMLRGGGDPFLKGAYGWTALHTAVASGRQRLVKILLTGPSNLVTTPSSSQTWLFSLLQRTKAVKRLPTLPKTTDSENTLTSNHPFASSSSNKNELLDEAEVDSTLPLLAAQRDGIDAQTEHGQTALHLAAHEGHAGSLNLLLYYGADPNVKDWKGRTPLFEACRRNNISCVKLLLANGASKTGLSSSGQSRDVQKVLDEFGEVASLRTLALLAIRRLVRGDIRHAQILPKELQAELFANI